MYTLQKACINKIKGNFFLYIYNKVILKHAIIQCWTIFIWKYDSESPYKFS